jgi:hypothetical protein
MSISSSDDERILGLPFDARRAQVLRDAQPVVDAVVRSSTVRRYINQLVEAAVATERQNVARSRELEAARAAGQLRTMVSNEHQAREQFQREITLEVVQTARTSPGS